MAGFIYFIYLTNIKKIIVKKKYILRFLIILKNLISTV